MLNIRGYERAQSEVTGVVLLTAVIVILAVLVGVTILSTVDTTDEPNANLRADIDGTELVLSHRGGSELRTDEITVILRNGGRQRLPLGNFSGDDGDGRFSAGEQLSHGYGVVDSLRVLVVHEPSNRVIYDRFLDVPPTVFPTLPWESAADWDAATSESGVLHDSFGDHSADRIELGYPKDEAGPIAYWPLDEDGGPTTRDVIGDNDGTINNATPGEPGILGTGSYGFNGTNDYVSGATNISALRNTASLSMWLKTTQRGDDTMYLAPGITGVESFGDGNDVFWGWIDSSGHIGIQSGDVAGAMSSTVVADGNWHHVVLTRDASSGAVEVYVDGTLEDTATSRSGEITTLFDSIGRIEDTGGTPEYFEGQLDELRVYDRVLSPENVSELGRSTMNGSLTTRNKQFDTPVDPTTLSLTDVSATVPTGTTINVTVESDPDGDGSFTGSDPIAISDDRNEYDVTGLSNESSTYRLRIELKTASITATPRFNSATLRSERR